MRPRSQSNAAPQSNEQPRTTVWRFSALILVAFLLVSVAAFVLGGRLEAILPQWIMIILRYALALSPGLIWYLPEKRLQDRAAARGLERHRAITGITFLSGVLALGAGSLLLDEVLRPEDWLPSAGGLERIQGYTLTTGIVEGFLKYAVMRYTAWPDQFRRREDGIYYGIAAGIGYAVALNIRYVLRLEPALSAASMRIAATTLSQVAFGAMLGFFLAEAARGQRRFYWLPGGFGLTAFITGIYIAFRAGVVVSGLGTSPIMGLAVSTGLAIVTFLVLAFFINVLDVREQGRLGIQGERL